MTATAETDLETARAQAAAAVRAAGSILISSHVNPDGDAVGSILGTALALAAAGKRALAVNPDPVPWTFQRLAQAPLVQTWPALPTFGRPDLWLALDSADEARLGVPEEARSMLAGVPRVQFDHHITNTRYAGVNIIEPAAAACCEQMTHFLVMAGFAIPPDAATSLLCGLVTDTGSFRYASVTSGTFRAASWLVDAGARPEEIGRLLSLRRFSATKLWGLVLTTLEQHHNGQIVVAFASRAMFDALALGDEGTEGLVETLRDIDGVDIAILLREEPSGQVKVSFRTSARADATVLALAYGGGGHPRAAGCTVAGPLATARQCMIDAAAQLLDQGAVRP